MRSLHCSSAIALSAFALLFFSTVSCKKDDTPRATIDLGMVDDETGELRRDKDTSTVPPSGRSTGSGSASSGLQADIEIFPSTFTRDNAAFYLDPPNSQLQVEIPRWTKAGSSVSIQLVYSGIAPDYEGRGMYAVLTNQGCWAEFTFTVSRGNVTTSSTVTMSGARPSSIDESPQAVAGFGAPLTFRVE
jgi:hypothetical protein